MRIVINADDLGMDQETNSEIFRLMAMRKISSSTIMANAPFMKEAVTQSSKYPQCSFGIHLNITEFYPLIDDQGLDPLLGNNGCFKTENENIRITRNTIKPLIDELSAQIKRLQSYGVNISHIDSHQHFHINPSIFPVIKYLQYKFNIRKIRLTREYPDTGDYGYRMRVKKKMFNFGLRHIVTSNTTDGFASLKGFVKHAEKIHEQCNSFEIMVHPGKSKEEDELFNSDWESTMPFKINYINYSQI